MTDNDITYQIRGAIYDVYNILNDSIHRIINNQFY